MALRPEDCRAIMVSRSGRRCRGATSGRVSNVHSVLTVNLKNGQDGPAAGVEDQRIGEQALGTLVGAASGDHVGRCAPNDASRSSGRVAIGEFELMVPPILLQVGSTTPVIQIPQCPSKSGPLSGSEPTHLIQPCNLAPFYTDGYSRFRPVVPPDHWAFRLRCG
jgi:hypothetical protein